MTRITSTAVLQLLLLAACPAPAPNPASQRCVANTDCGPGELCTILGQCIRAPGCHSDADCGAGEICDVSGSCLEAADAGTGPSDAGRADAGGPDAGSTDAGTCAPTVDLTSDPRNCGSCGHVCSVTPPSTVGCIQSRCIAALAHSPFPSGLSADDSSLYWTDEGPESGVASGAVNQISKTGGTLQPLATSRPEPFDIQVDSGEVYWAELANQAETNQIGGIYSIPATGGSPTTRLGSIEYPYHMAETNGDFAYSTASPQFQLSVEHGGTTSTIYNGGIDALTVRGSTVYWKTEATFNSAGNGCNTDGLVLSAPITGGRVTTIASGLGCASGIAVDATNAYLTEGGLDFSAGDQLTWGTVLEINLASGTITTLAGDYMQGLDITCDSETVYWNSFRDADSNGMTTGSGSVRSVPIAGGAVTTIQSGQTAPIGIVVDGNAVYWMVQSSYEGTSTGAGGTVMSANPK